MRTWEESYKIDGDLQAAMGLQDLVARVQRTVEAGPNVTS